MNKQEIIARTENLLYASGDSFDGAELAAYLEVSSEELFQVISEESKRREEEGAGLLFQIYNGRIQLSTRPEFGEMIFALLGKKSRAELTRAMMETLAIVAYRQPITRMEIEEIRGVNSSYIVSSLLQKGLIKEAGRKDTIGKPMLFQTTEEFLRHFGIHSIEELPKLHEQETFFEEEA